LSNNRGNNRRRGRGNNRPQGNQQMNRIDSRARGNAPQLLEKYRKLAHDSHLNGDRVLEEYYLQFADHYFRVMADVRQRQEDSRPRRDERMHDGGDGWRDDGDDSGDYGSEYDTPPPRREQAASSRSDESGERRQDERIEAQENGEAQSDPYEPAENPFVRGNRGAKSRPSRRGSRENRNEGEAEAGAGAGEELQTAAPPAQAEPEAQAPAGAAADEADASEKPKKLSTRTRRRSPRDAVPPADEAGESLRAVN
jgi:hypothetical protein